MSGFEAIAYKNQLINEVVVSCPYVQLAVI
jgi:hypothetical protein